MEETTANVLYTHNLVGCSASKMLRAVQVAFPGQAGVLTEGHLHHHHQHQHHIVTLVSASASSPQHHQHIIVIIIDLLDVVWRLLGAQPLTLHNADWLNTHLQLGPLGDVLISCISIHVSSLTILLDPSEVRVRSQLLTTHLLFRCVLDACDASTTAGGDDAIGRKRRGGGGRGGGYDALRQLLWAGLQVREAYHVTIVAKISNVWNDCEEGKRNDVDTYERLLNTMTELCVLTQGRGEDRTEVAVDGVRPPSQTSQYRRLYLVRHLSSMAQGALTFTARITEPKGRAELRCVLADTMHQYSFSLPHSCTHARIHSLMHSLVHSLSHSHSHSLTLSHCLHDMFGVPESSVNSILTAHWDGYDNLDHYTLFAQLSQLFPPLDQGIPLWTDFLAIMKTSKRTEANTHGSSHGSTSKHATQIHREPHTA